MSDLPSSVRAPGTRRLLAGPRPVTLAIALWAAGCSPGSAPSPAGDGTTSKVPEIAARQRHMADMLKKSASKANPPAPPR